MSPDHFPPPISPASISLRVNAPTLSRRGLLRNTGLMIAAGGLLAACGSNRAAPSPKRPDTQPTIEAKPDGDLTWLGFDGYFAPEVVSGFEKKYGVKVNLTYMNSNADLLPKMSSGQPIDMCTGNSAVLDSMIAAKLIQPFATAAVPNWDRLAPFFAAPFYDNGSARYSSIYNIYAPTILVRTDKLPTAENSIDDLWNLRDEAKGHISLFDDAPTNFGNALVHLGRNLRNPTNQDITDAADALLQLTPNIIGFQGPQMADVATGKTWLGSIQDYTNAEQVFTGPYFDHIKMTYAKKPWLETDLLCIGANAQSPGTALLFINWLLEDEQSVAQANFFTINNGIPAGTKACADGPLRQKAPNFYPEPLTDEKLMNDQSLWLTTPAGDLGRLMTQQWSRVKAS